MAAGRTALITGASSGIGLDLASVFAADRWDLILVARSEAKLRETAAGLERGFGIEARVLRADLSDAGAPRAIAAWLGEHGVRVEALVNNAGFGVYGPFAKTDIETELNMIQVNVTALVHLTKRLLGGMLERGRGRILNVASTAAFQPGPLMAVYYATKSFVLSFSEALACELEGSGVAVTALCPGPTQTAFQTGADMQASRLVRGPLMMDSLSVARVGYEGLMRGKTLVIPGLTNRLMAGVVPFMPRRTVTRCVRRAMSPAAPRRPS
jgi:short-subunit dehydrogenase